MNRFKRGSLISVKHLVPYLQCSLLAVAIFALTACNTLPEKAHTPPQRPHIEQPPPQEMQSRSEQQQNSQPPSGQPPPSSQQSQTEPADSAPPPQQAQSAPPPSAEEPDVQITDIPVDEDGNPIIEPQQTASQSAQNRDSSRQSSGGGAPTPPDGQTEQDSGRSSDSDSQIAGAEGGPVVNIGAMTEAERVAALGKNLDGKLAKFDELMRRAREGAERDRAAASAGGRYGAASSGRDAGETPLQSGRGAGGQADSSSGRGHQPDLTGSGEGDYKYASGGPTPQDIPDSRDDDIVARQLREAASSEADPVLREKLWDEYRKYKKGIGR
jgi:hypothetical protein